MLEIIAAFILSYAGFSSLNLRFNHQRAHSWGMRDTPTLPNWAFKVGGCLLLGLALLPAVLSWGLGAGLGMGLLMLALAACLQTKLLAHAPAMAIGMAPTGMVIGLACASLAVLSV